MPILIEGKNPLRGQVDLSGSKNAGSKLIYAALYSNEDVILDNVPRVDSIIYDMETVRSLGAKAEWIGSNKVLINGSGVSSFEIPQEIGSKYRSSFLAVGPLLFRFGKARIPKVKEVPFKASPINRIIETWISLGFEVVQKDDWIDVSVSKPKPAELIFKTSSHTGTDNAILSSLFIEGETNINNASEEPEIDDLIKFANILGATVERVEPRKIKVTGNNVFGGGLFSIQPDKNEAAIFATAAIITGGNIIIKGIQKLSLTAFLNFLSKIDANYEVSQDELKVWSGSAIKPLDLAVTPSPGFVPDWQMLATLILTQAHGNSTVHDTVYTDRFEYVRDLNRMGADIELVRPTDASLTPIISDDSYDYQTLGEPLTVSKIKGPSKFHPEKLHIIDPRFANVYVLAALAAEGKSEINGYVSMYEPTENFFDKLIKLGAKITRSGKD